MGDRGEVFGRVYAAVAVGSDGDHDCAELGPAGGGDEDLPLGTAYAVWTGIGAVGTVVLGFVLFGESAALSGPSDRHRINTDYARRVEAVSVNEREIKLASLGGQNYAGSNRNRIPDFCFGRW